MHASLADVFADTAQNSIEAGASRIDATIVEDGWKVTVTITDNGKGMDEETKARAFSPFYTEPGKHDKRKVGLGLPFLKQICDACGGGVSLESTKGVGTTLKYWFDARNIDLPPWGELPRAMVTLFNYPGDFEFVFTHRKMAEEYTIARSELSEAIGGFDSVPSLALAAQFFASQEEALVHPQEELDE